MDDKAMARPTPSDTRSDPTAGGCGCVPMSAPPADVLKNADGGSRSEASLPPEKSAEEDASPATALPRRALKIVVTSRLLEDARLGVVLAVGSDGCDPLFRTIDVERLEEALAAVPALVATAETRWQSQPRHPSSARVPRAKASVPTDQPALSPAANETGDPSSAATATAEPASKPAENCPSPTKGPTPQLPLFG